MFVIERLIDMAADLHGFDPIELRRRNLIRPDELPYRNPTGVTYDKGEYERVMDHAMRLGEWGNILTATGGRQEAWQTSRNWARELHRTHHGQPA